MSDVTTPPPRPIRTTPPPLSPVDSVDFDDYGGPPLYDSSPPTASPLRRTYAKPPPKALEAKPAPVERQPIPDATTGELRRTTTTAPVNVHHYVGRQPKWYDHYVMALAILAGLTYAIWQARRQRQTTVKRMGEQAKEQRRHSHHRC